ncbi:hypothetical protein [Methylocucumis oryzae]|uniref:Uncharacterized protein n=1 Tax=Methylocucumis oryzae TaxID=1632867 RepID=A0A0F3IL56_9GAMM|nr:hypothetical protein [Methylocucumis oryzae]KJV06289.1 hypothetical protein VZ94_12185 [Methylocucumis oryzae]
MLGSLQAQPKSLLALAIVKYQHILYWLYLSLLIVGLTIESFHFVVTGKFKERAFSVRSPKSWVFILILAGYFLNNFPLFMAKLCGWRLFY